MLKGARLVKKWTVVFTKQAQKDAKKIARSGLRPQAERLLDVLADNPFQNPPPYEKLVGDLAGACSRRINIQHRLIYQVLDDIRTVKIIRMWTHYE
ncbi:MAG TPA: Txe/YoeB family addiction module toxin [Kiritimatiellia bacterium]|nr:Txe/YoeB family addiction module toxin [Kiritimatiellia bacterium]HMO52808.1 Txe/YoeB family addiction module toxin [Kiritimatiellia bacterium]HMP00733.1 Txe/YoeB family addiction module toxin [Kiritimatiellia bacterium]HMP00742.1 Txe/YoeB family addiction module toxin [Kiritimatiellia bacterium]